MTKKKKGEKQKKGLRENKDETNIRLSKNE